MFKMGDTGNEYVIFDHPLDEEMGNADVDGSDSHIGVFPRREAGEFDRDIEFSARADFLRRAEFHVELVRARVDAEPRDAERAAGHALCRSVERPVPKGEGVSARAPARRDRDADFIVALPQVADASGFQFFRNFRGLQRFQALAGQNGELKFTAARWKRAPPEIFARGGDLDV